MYYGCSLVKKDKTPTDRPIFKEKALVLYQKLQDESEEMYTYILENKMFSVCIIFKASLA